MSLSFNKLYITKARVQSHTQIMEGDKKRLLVGISESMAANHQSLIDKVVEHALKPNMTKEKVVKFRDKVVGRSAFGSLCPLVLSVWPLVLCFSLSRFGSLSLSLSLLLSLSLSLSLSLPLSLSISPSPLPVPLPSLSLSLSLSFSFSPFSPYISFSLCAGPLEEFLTLVVAARSTRTIELRGLASTPRALACLATCLTTEIEQGTQELTGNASHG